MPKEHCAFGAVLKHCHGAVAVLRIDRLLVELSRGFSVDLCLLLLLLL
jgi:hypothetical protein